MAQRGLGSGVGVKELPSECYRPQTDPPPNSRSDPKTAFSAQSGGTPRRVAEQKTLLVRPINRWCQN